MYVQKSSDKQPLTNNDDLSRKERIKVAYQQWVSVTTWHGVPDAFRADSLCPKLFWGLVLLGATVMLIYQLVNVIDDYASNSHYVTAVAAVQLDSGAPWPNITICNYNRANSSKLSSIKMNPEAVSYIYGTLPQYYMTSAYTMDASVFQNLSDAYQIFLQFYSPAPTVNDIFNYIGHDCAPMMIGCWWTGLRFNCCDNVQTILSVYGKCYSVTPPNSDPWGAGNPPFQSVPGPGNALSLLVDPGLQYYSRAYYNDYLAEGILLLVNFEPQALWPIDQIALTPGEVGFLSLSLSYTYTNTPKVKVFQPNCRQSANYKYMTGNYSLNQCIMDCFMQAVASTCNCLFSMGAGGSNLVNPSGLRLCDVQDHICYVKLLYGSVAPFGDAYANFNNCSKGCDPPCSATYQVKTALSTTRSLEVTNRKLKRLVPEVNDTTQLIQLDIYFPFVGYMEYSTSERVSVFDFICNIGGQLGLWAGMSIISIAQMCFFCSSVISCSKFRCPRRHKTSP